MSEATTLSKQAQEILDAHVIYQIEYTHNTRGEYQVLIFFLTLAYLIPAGILRIERWPFPEAWIVFLFFYPLLPYFLYLRPGIKMTREYKLVVSEKGVYIQSGETGSCLGWNRISAIGIGQYGGFSVFEDPPLVTSKGQTYATLGIPHHPRLKDFLVELSDGKRILPGEPEILFYDHPRFLPGPPKTHE